MCASSCWSGRRISRLVGLLTITACLFVSMFAGATPHGPETKYHPFSMKKNGDLNYKWFPIG